MHVLQKKAVEREIVKVEKTLLQKVGTWAFIGGVIISIIAGFFELSAVWTSVLVGLGLIVGLLNISGKESLSFVLLTVGLVVLSVVGGSIIGKTDLVGTQLSNILNAIVVFVVPAGIVVCVRGIYGLAED